MLDKAAPASRLNLLLVALVLCGLCLGLGAAGGYRYATAQGTAALATAEATRAKEHEAAAEQRARQALVASGRLAQQVLRAHALETQLSNAKAQHAQEKKALLKRIADVTTVYVPSPGAAPELLPRSVFTAGFVREYNAAIGIGSDLPGAAQGTTAAAASTASGSSSSTEAWLRESGLSQADILAHVGDYGEYCRNLSAQVNGLLDEIAGEAGGVDGHH